MMTSSSFLLTAGRNHHHELGWRHPQLSHVALQHSEDTHDSWHTVDIMTAKGMRYDSS